MFNQYFLLKKNSTLLCACCWLLLVMGYSLPASAIDLAQKPLFIGQSAKPVVMLAMSRDQELSYSAYPDYSNLDGGYLTAADTTYRNDFDYYGYFNSKWCYEYVADTSTTKNSYFTPSELATNHKCNSKWSGNFLNWASMTRMDVLRKVLYGGARATDTAATTDTEAVTILERHYIPKESHAFGKVYSGADGSVSDYTPYSDSVITMCNVSTASGSSGYPVIRVVTGAWWNWSHTEEQQCQWRSTNNNTYSSPYTTQRLGEMVAKVKVCVAGKDVEGNTYNSSDKNTLSAGCNSYQSGSYKPIGILQKKADTINFGLVTGSWTKPGEGGVLRKKAGPLAGEQTTSPDNVNEFSTSTGVFNANVKGIIHNINNIRINQYSYSATDGRINYSGNSDWRNPIGEIYGETLRYLASKDKDGNGKIWPKFDADDTWANSNMTRVSEWNDPLPSGSWCANCSIILLSSGANSFDGDNLTNDYLQTINANLTRTELSNRVDNIGQNEFGSQTNSFYMGLAANASLSTQCSVGDLKLSQLRGVCPEFPTGQGTYDIAGLAHFAHTQDMRSGYDGKQTVSTYAVELSEGLPSFAIPIGTGKVSIVPVCTNNTHSNACSLVGVRVESIVTDASGNPIAGQYLFYWEDQPWASDYDMDAVQRINFCVGSACGGGVNANQIKITNSLPYWATGTGRMHMSYNIQGVDSNNLQTGQWVTRAGYSPHNFGKKSSDPKQPWEWYNHMDGGDALPQNNGNDVYLMTKTFTVATTAAAASLTGLRSPLFYAAKYGQFSDINNNGIPDSAAEWDQKNTKGETVTNGDGLPDNYFMMKNPALLEGGILAMIENISRESASGAGVATNSTRLDEGTFVYQALFNTDGWHGEIKAFTASNTSSENFKEIWTTKGSFTSSSGRKIFTYNPVNDLGYEFKTDNLASLSPAQRTALGSNNTTRRNIINWVRGDNITGYRSREMKDGRTNLLGDIVNSTPVFAGAAGEGHDKLTDEVFGGKDYNKYLKDVKAKRTNILYASSNDGMLHAINANCTPTNVGDCGKEVFAYVPSMIYDKLPLVAAVDYAKTGHQYLVDGPITIGDAYVKLPGRSEREWRNILVGTLGGGGRGIFVLDVTDPGSFGAGNVLFEITASDMSQIGNVFGKPYIAPIDGKWKVVLGNGYNSTSGTASLLVIDIEAPFDASKSIAIPTNSSNNNGLAGPALYRSAGNVAIQTAYAGDYLGNLWKFDLNRSVASMRPAFGTAPDYSPLFFASKGGVRQPITSAPTLGLKDGDVVGGGDAVMIYFGTGSYLTTTDVSSTSVQSFYGIADEIGASSAIVYGTSRDTVLHKKTMTTSGKTRDVDDSGTSPVTPDWESDKGWYVDFPAGERMVTKPLLVYDRILFSTIIPNTDGCSFGGSGWLMELVATGNENIRGLDKSLLPHNGSYLDNFIPGELVKLKNSDLSSSGSDTLIYSDITGELTATVIDGGIDSDELGRMSWRQLQ